MFGASTTVRRAVEPRRRVRPRARTRRSVGALEVRAQELPAAVDLGVVPLVADVTAPDHARARALQVRHEPGGLRIVADHHVVRAHQRVELDLVVARHALEERGLLGPERRAVAREPCSALCSRLVMRKNSGGPSITSQRAAMPSPARSAASTAASRRRHRRPVELMFQIARVPSRLRRSPARRASAVIRSCPRNSANGETDRAPMLTSYMRDRGSRE